MSCIEENGGKIKEWSQTEKLGKIKREKRSNSR